MDKIIEHIASFASIIGCILSFILMFYSESIKIWISIFFMLIFLFMSVVTRIHLNHSKHYLAAFKTIQEIHYKVLKNQNKYNQFNVYQSISELSDVCSDISEMFTTLRRHQISVCIKYTNKQNRDYYVKTLCRDNESKRKRKKLYDDEKLDLINQNTDFEYIFGKLNEKRDWRVIFYSANHLPWKHQYKNSHLKSDDLSENPWSRNKKWPLPYKSTIVVPIVSDDKIINYGYLCVDSPKNRGFNSNFDIKIVQDLALLLSPTIRLVSENHLIKPKKSNKIK